MKRKIFLSVLLVSIIILFNSCGLFFGTSIEDRMGQFESDLNSSDRTGIWDNFYSGCNQINTIRSTTYWDNHSIFQNHEWNIVIPSDPDDLFTTTGTHTSGTSGTLNIKFQMENEGSIFSGKDWKISILWIDSILQID